MAKGGPKNATTRGGKRFYTWRNEKFWSVTTILNVVPKPALLPWGMKAVATSAVDNLDIVNAMVQRGDPEGAIDWLKRSPYRDRDKAADLGSRVHDACESYRLGKPMPEWDEDVKPRMDNFIQWLETYKPEFLAVEASVYNRTQHYAGTLDAIIRLNGQTLVLDYKTAKSGLYPEVGLQLAAYRRAEFIGLPDGTEKPMPETDGAAALWIRNGEFVPAEQFIGVNTDAEVWNSFLYTREMFRWQEQVSKRVLGGCITPDIVNASPEDAQAALGIQGVSP